MAGLTGLKAQPVSITLLVGTKPKSSCSLLPCRTAASRDAIQILNSSVKLRPNLRIRGASIALSRRTHSECT